MRRHTFLLVLLALSSQICLAQASAVDPDERTLTVSAEGTAEAAAEIAILEIGYQNEAETHAKAYAENLVASNRIVKALLEAGVPEEAIETEGLELDEREDRDGKAYYRAFQKWRVRVATGQAQRAVDVAVGAGANAVERIEWTVLNPAELEAKANAAALAKARILAQQMAKTLGVRLGELRQVNNYRMGVNIITKSGTVETATTAEELSGTAHLRLFPKKVRGHASVTVVYSFEPGS